MKLLQTPSPEKNLLLFRGNILKVTLELSAGAEGCAFFRSNIGKAALFRSEVVRSIEEDHPVHAKDWHDLPMKKAGERLYEVSLPLLETGCFEGKAFFLPEGSKTPLWPDGDNTIIKVDPAETCCSNTVYTAFVRQFGPNKKKKQHLDDRIVSKLDSHEYTVIPKSGTFRDLIAELDFIICELGFRYIHLLPIHPVPTTYARMGRFGSPFAVMNFFNVDPALAEFDRMTTPLEQFEELVDEAHKRNGRIMIDIPINHTGWASQLQIDHPEWFKRGHDDSFVSPGAWGTTWADLSELDYSNRELWLYMADVFLFWCRRGVDAFRCDAGYMIPVPVWRYIVAKVRQEFPDAIFFLEGLGGKISVMESLLVDADLNWAYSELFQNYDQNQVAGYLSHSSGISTTKGTLLHFAETHDNTRLAAKSGLYAEMRTSLSAMASHSGAFGITNGVEWLAKDRVNVHEAESLNWGSRKNLVDHIKKLTRIVSTHPAFFPGVEVRTVQNSHSNSIALLRNTGDEATSLLVLINLSEKHPATVTWHESDFAVTGRNMVDVLHSRSLDFSAQHGVAAHDLEPGEVICIGSGQDVSVERRAETQEMIALSLEIMQHYSSCQSVEDLDVMKLAAELAEDPVGFFTKTAAGCGTDFPMLTRWVWPRDTARTVMIPPGHFLYVECPHDFLVEIRKDGRVLHHSYSLRSNGGSRFRIIPPIASERIDEDYHLHITVYKDDGIKKDSIRLMPLCTVESADVRTFFSRDECLDNGSYALCTNGRGAMSHVRSSWGSLESRYDCILGANRDERQPVDRQIMFTRCRAWLVRRGFSQAVNGDCMVSFEQDAAGVVTWKFSVPVGKGDFVPFEISSHMVPKKNAVILRFKRQESEHAKLTGFDQIQLILRPDLENRSFHSITKAYTGIEDRWPADVESEEKGFVFSPEHCMALKMTVDHGSFNQEPEWEYMVNLPNDGERGMDSSTDLFSPGYFAIDLNSGSEVALLAEAYDDAPSCSVDQEGPALPGFDERIVSLRETAANGVKDYIVARDGLKTVIAGYPWFLDWGRDTLICLRGVISAGLLTESSEILKAFAKFERNGTLPNMLNGSDDSNRDTSDAPLWFFVACSDLIKAERSNSLLQAVCGDRSLKKIMESIVEHYISGTPNGIKMDPGSGLVYSPSHYTWMDTNHPAGTPREGYPIEIQALWHFALDFLCSHGYEDRYGELKAQVRESIKKYFMLNGNAGGSGALSDCLHTKGYAPADQAEADDAVRSNQLLAITLGAIEDRSVCASVLASCEELLVPGGIRSLADRPVEYQLPVYRDGHLLNDPSHPYWGRYEGDEDTRRKPAYHNGTAWTWPFPSYSEALFMVYGEDARATAMAILASSADVMNKDCIGQVPEIIDGNYPHVSRGCGAQAWGVTELLRVLNQFC